MAQKKRTLADVLKELIDRSNSEIMRLRILEQSAEISKTRVSNTEKQVLEIRSDMRGSMKKIGEDISALDERVAKIETTIKDIINELKKFITISKIKEIEQMIEIFNPLKSKFVTEEEVERILEEWSRSKRNL